MTALTTRLLHSPPAGSLPAVSLAELIDMTETARLAGRGGVALPTAIKLRAVAGAKNVVVVGNAMEGEPLSDKDHVLLGTAPHLVTEGLAIVAGALGATRCVIGVSRHMSTGPLEAAAARYDIDVVTIDGGFVSGQESALVRGLSGLTAVPADPLVRVAEHAVSGRPTVVLNVETLAQLALVARFGPAASTTSLFTISGAVDAPGVVEAAWSASLAEVVAMGRPRSIRAVLVGGFHGTWMSGGDLCAPLSQTRVGAGVLHVLGTDVCPLQAVSDIAGYLAGESARQCGPCINGLPRIAETLRRLADGPLDSAVPAEVERLCGLTVGRGACGHPDGAVRMVLSALGVFRDEVELHCAGRCSL